MVKPFYQFGNSIFKDELWNEYIIPVAKWFLHDSKKEGYLLPQFSGSVWECSLAIDFLLKLLDHDKLSDDLIAQIKVKIINTARWLISSIRDEESVRGKSWDSAPWDTAVALRSLISCFDRFKTDFTEDEQTLFNKITIDICNWLIVQSKNWKGPDGYLTADSTDLAVALSALILVQQRFPQEFAVLEAKHGQDNCIESTAHMLIQCAAEGNENGKQKYNFDNWGRGFSIGEVICGLCSFVSWNKCSDNDKNTAQSLILGGLKRIEYEQNHGGITENSVADSCGITWSYLVASRSLPQVGHDDTMVFRSLCWMCDSNKVLEDGSFLHTTYATVFYALSLIEAYETWELGSKSTNEVYNYVVWLNPNADTIERAKRLDLELKALKIEQKLKYVEAQKKDSTVKKYTVFTICALVIITIIIMQAVNALSFISFNLKINDRTLFFSILGVALVIIPMISNYVRKYAQKRKSSFSDASIEIGSSNHDSL